MNTCPVTILLPVKNGSKYLGRIIQNIESSVRPCDEVLFIEDNSEDDSLFILSKLCEGKKMYRIIMNDGYGLVDALNLGIREAQFEWVARYDVDDLYSNDRIDKQLSIVNETTVAVFTDYEFISESGRSFGVIPTAIYPGITELSVVSGQRLPHPSSMYRKSAVIAAGGYKKNEFPAEDLGLWLRLAKLGDFRSYPETLLRYQLSYSSISSEKRALMTQKKKELLGQTNEMSMIVSKVKLSITDIFSMYFGQRLYWERTLFLLRDLEIARKQNILSSDMLLAARFAKALALINPHTYLIIIKHLFYKRLRDRQRDINSPKMLGP